jgi:phosphatidylserine/phosphatidylglycerophosphate/cardiolipin synthase-like enzyme
METLSKRFYHRIEDKINGDTVEVYIGQGAGTQLGNDLMNASSEVIIVSPYIDEQKLDELFMLKKRNIYVKLAFSSLNEKQEYSILRKLIRQKQIKDHEAAARAKRSAQHNGILSTIFLVAAIAFFTNLYFHFQWPQLVFSLILGYLAYYFMDKRTLSNKLPIYSYEYEENLHFKYFRNTNYGAQSSPFVHSKIYIIDRKIAYLGSVNFTRNGFESNFETRIRITNTNKVNELLYFVNQLLDTNDYLNCHRLDWLGKKVYREYYFE